MAGGATLLQLHDDSNTGVLRFCDNRLERPEYSFTP